MNLSNNIAIFAGVTGVLLTCVVFGLAKIIGRALRNREPEDDRPRGDGAWLRRD